MNRFNRLIQKQHTLFANHQGVVIINKLRSIRRAFLSKFIRWYYHCDIPSCIDISGCYFCHKGFGVVINPHTKLGKNITIQHSVTIGQIGDKVPTIGNNVFIGSGAIIIGGISIGNDVKIGAGTVVTKNVPDGSTIVGAPSRIIINKQNE